MFQNKATQMHTGVKINYFKNKYLICCNNFPLSETIYLILFMLEKICLEAIYLLIFLINLKHENM